MKNLILILWGILFAIPFSAASTASDSTSVFKLYEINTNPLTGKRYFGTLKVNTLQVLFAEAPFSLEIFLRNDLSIQFQAGIIFPLESDSFLEQIFRSPELNSTISRNSLISYRTSPYNNHGLSFKAEIRKYTSEFYFAPQVMYKYCRYDEAVFPVVIEDRTMRQTENKHSRIFGLGLIIGRQTYFVKQATDWYVGLGARAREISATVLKIEDPSSTSRYIYPGKVENSFRVYPFLNFGFRIGLVL